MLLLLLSLSVVAGEKLVPECLQYRATPRHVAEAALAFLKDPVKLEWMRRGLLEIRGKLGKEGASLRAAQVILKELGNSALVRNP